MTEDAAVAAALDTLPLTRLAHFTPARNLPPIISNGQLRSVRDLSDDARAHYAATDLLRLDGYPDKICCSFEYPNGFYFDKAAARPDAANYSDWVCLLIDKRAAAADGTLFCPRNAASTAVCTPGVAGLNACYAPSVEGSGGRTFTRGINHRTACATDVQAEVLVPGPIPLSAVSSIVVPTAEAAVQEHGRLAQFGLTVPPHITWLVSPDMFRKYAISDAVRYSYDLTETPWTGATPSDATAAGQS